MWWKRWANSKRSIFALWNSAAPLVTLLVEAGAEIEEVRRDRPTLEEAFLELVTTDADAMEVQR